MKYVQKDTASLIDQPDSICVLTSGSGRDSRLPKLFNFDGELSISRPYSQMIWKTVKLSFPSQDQKAYQRLSNAEPETADIGEKPNLSRENTIKDGKPGRRKVVVSNFIHYRLRF